MHDDNEAATSSVLPAVGGLLVTAVSHGVRTPLHSLLGFLELLSTSDLNDEASGLLHEARGGGDELLAASDRLLMLLRLLTGDPVHAPQPFSPADLLHEIAMTAGPKGAIWVDANPYLPASLEGNVEFVRQLVFELASNAVRHGAQQTRIYAERVTGFAQTPVRVRFTVSDDGPGLPPEALRRLTVSHGRFDEDPNQVGLFLARRLAASLDTELVVAQSDERGTTITFEISLSDPAIAGPILPRPAPVEPAEPGLQPRSLRVLLVEDNSVNRILAQRQMARLGHRLDTKTDGTDGVRAVLAGTYDVVLMDRHLPDIDGIESTRRIREGESAMVPPRHTPIIAVTADASPGHRQECQAAGMDGFLTKPLDLEHLRLALLSVTAAPEPDAAGSHTTPAEPDVDPAALNELRRNLAGDSNAVADVMRTYLDELPARRMRLQAALGRAESRQAAAAAETLWTSSGAVGALRLAELCEQIHHAARTGDLERGRALLPDLRETCDRTATALKEFLPVTGGNRPA